MPSSGVVPLVVRVVVFLALPLSLWGCRSHTGCPPPPEDVRPLVPGETVERSIRPDESQGYRIDLEEGDFVAVSADQHGADVELSLRGPDGCEVVWADSPNGPNGPERLFAIAESGGEHTLALGSEGSCTGGYTLRIEVRRPSRVDRLRARGSRLLATKTVPALIQAMWLWRALGEPYLEAVASIWLANHLRFRGHNQGAIQLLEPLRDRISSLSAPELEPAVLEVLGGSLLHSSGDSKEVLDDLEQALAAARERGDSFQEGRILIDLGTWFRFHGQPGYALSLLDLAVEHQRWLQDDQGWAVALHTRGDLLNWLGREDDALEDYGKALELRRQIKIPNDLAATLTEIGWTEMWAGKTEPAESHMKEALGIYQSIGDRQGQAGCLDRLGTLERRRGNFVQAREKFLAAIGLFVDPVKAAASHNNLGRTLRELGQPEKALLEHERALEVFREQDKPSDEATVLFDLALAHEDLGDTEMALRDFEESVDGLETLRAESRQGLRSSYLATVHKTYERYADLLMSLGHREEALGVVERGHARTLLDLIARVDQPGAGRGRREIRADLLARRGELGRRLRETLALRAQLTGSDALEERRAEAESRVQELARERDDLQGELVGAPPSDYLAQPRSLDQIRAALDPDTVLVVFSLGADRSHVWALTSDALTSADLPSQKEIESTLEPLLEELSHPKPVLAPSTASRPLAEELEQAGEMLLGEVLPALADHRLVVVPDGILHRLPFAALRLDGHYLIEDHKVSRLPSASVLVSLRERSAHKSPPAGWLALIADPVFRPDDLRLPNAAADADGPRPGDPPELDLYPRLQASGEEAKSIAWRVSPECLEPELGFDANRERALSGRLSGYRLIHLATHARLDLGQPELSGVLLSRFDAHGRPQNGFLYAFEIAEMDLPADLVVLSACDTGLGKAVRGEGLVGLPQSFFEAGADRVLVSLWKVDDTSTARLMDRFYQGLLDRKLSPPAALQEAQMGMQEADGGVWREPYYWAGFTLLGDWRPLPSTLFASPCLQE